MPKITAVIPMYNRAPYINAAIDSLLAQKKVDFEIIVVDDGSSDTSRERVETYADHRIRLLCHHTNRGIAASRNTGVDAARGEYVAFLDSDDIALPTRLARQSAFLDGNPNHAVVGSWIRLIDSTGKRFGRTRRKPTASDQIAAERLFRLCLENTTTMARTAILRAHPQRPRFAQGEDYDVWSRIAENYQMASLPAPLVYRRRHDQQISQSQRAQAEQCLLQIFHDQLTRLGVVFDATELHRHALLRRMQNLGFVPDMAFIDWTEDWLIRLQTANQRSGLYPEPAFSALLATVWCKTCWLAMRRSRRQILKRFCASPLYQALGYGLRAQARTRFGPAAIPAA